MLSIAFGLLSAPYIVYLSSTIRLFSDELPYAVIAQSAGAMAGSGLFIAGLFIGHLSRGTPLARMRKRVLRSAAAVAATFVIAAWSAWNGACAPEWIVAAWTFAMCCSSLCSGFVIFNLSVRYLDAHRERASTLTGLFTTLQLGIAALASQTLLLAFGSARGMLFLSLSVLYLFATAILVRAVNRAGEPARGS